MRPKTFNYDRLVKSEDLNHHRTLFAGRCAEWFVEAGFIAAASVLPPHNVVCLKIHGLSFTHPIKPGEITCFKSKIVHTGRSSLKVYVSLNVHNDPTPVVKGFITFVNVDEDGKAKPHNLRLELSDPEEIELNRQAAKLN